MIIILCTHHIYVIIQRVHHHHQHVKYHHHLCFRHQKSRSRCNLVQRKACKRNTYSGRKCREKSYVYCIVYIYIYNFSKGHKLSEIHFDSDILRQMVQFLSQQRDTTKRGQANLSIYPIYVMNIKKKKRYILTSWWQDKPPPLRCSNIAFSFFICYTVSSFIITAYISLPTFLCA